MCFRVASNVAKFHKIRRTKMNLKYQKSQAKIIRRTVNHKQETQKSLKVTKTINLHKNDQNR